MYTKIMSAGVFGMNAYPVEVEVDTFRGLPSFEIVGLPDAAVKESRDCLLYTSDAATIA